MNPKRNLTTDQIISIAMQEYTISNERLSSIDELRFKVKSWSITAGAAAIGGGFIYDKAVLMLIGSLAATMFWVIESFYKMRQVPLIQRLHYIEQNLKKDIMAYDGPGLHLTYAALHESRLYKLGIALYQLFTITVALPHAVIAVFGFAVYLLHAGLIQR